MDEKPEPVPLKRDGKTFPLPPGALALVTPWLVSKSTGQYVGLPSDPLLRQITELAELAGEVPEVTGCFLAWNHNIVLGDTPRRDAISDDHPASHEHSLPHDHSATLNVPVFNRLGMVDDDDDRVSLSYAAENHTHEVTTAWDAVKLSEEDRQAWFEPLHYEVSAFIVDDAGVSTAVPAGMLAFLDEDIDSIPGWRRMDAETLGRDPREPDPTYAPRLWGEEAFKVVGCTPDKHRKGLRDHTHDVPRHNHRGEGEVTTASASLRADEDSGGQGAALPSHSHPVTGITDAVGVLSPAPNMRRHRKMTVWVAEEDGVDVASGMLIPYIPQNRHVLNFLYVFGPDGWRVAFEPESSDIQPVFVTAGKFPAGRIPNGTDQPGEAYGENLHSHRYQHTHRIDFGSATKWRMAEHDDDDIRVSEVGHGHAPVYVEHDDYTSETRNPMRYRRVLFIRKT